MNGLTLRINRSAGIKPKNSIGFSPVNLETFKDKGENELFKNFADAETTDAQLTILKNILDQYKDSVMSEVIEFLAVVFLQAEPKHPVKCCISRHITKNIQLQQQFTDTLASQVTVLIADIPTDHRQYVDVVSKVALCYENFNAGAAAVRLVEVNLANYLKDCLKFCIKILSDTKSLSPTEKNEIFNLAHLCLRVLLHITQKGNSDSYSKLILMFEEIRSSIQALMFDDDVPMDTKSVCGILYLSMYVLENGPDSWVDILSNSSRHNSLVTLLKVEASQLCLYSAIVTVVSTDSLLKQTVGDKPAIIDLMYKVLDIGDRSSSDSAFILGVTRTLVQISKQLDKMADRAAGHSLVDALLTFAWSHLDHYMDSVRHLTAQLLATAVGYCAKLDREGDDTALAKLVSSFSTLDTSRRSYYVSVTCLVTQLGAARVLRTWPDLLQHLLAALRLQHVQASATTALESLLAKHAACSSTQQLEETWLRTVVAHIQQNLLDSAQLNILENLLVSAVKLDPNLIDYIVQHIKKSCEADKPPRDLKCILMLLSVARKSTSRLLTTSAEDHWKGLIKYDVLKLAAIDAVDEIRILSLSLVVESPKTTEPFTEGDLSFVLYYLKYNINAQAPSFRQLTLSVMKKFLKRVEESYKVIRRQKGPNGENHKVQYYLRFLEQFRAECLASLLPGANYSRRCVALQLLLWAQRLPLEGYHREWPRQYIDRLLLHLEDSYENNKALALDILTTCPAHLLKDNKYSISLDLKDIFAQASSLKPTDCVSAAYKIDFVRRALPERVPQAQLGTAEAGTYWLVAALLRELRAQLAVCEASSVVRAASSAPMYGVLHVTAHLLHTLHPQSISSDPRWTSLIGELIATCMAVSASVSCVVNNSSPEGHLPMDMSGVLVTDHGNSGGVVLDDGRQVTSQMVLLCAWRSVKEVSLLLGSISSRFTIAGEDGPSGTLTCEQLERIGEHFTSLLAETKHRGAFEQAYVGFTKLLSRLWRCRSASLHGLPGAWLAQLTRDIVSGERTELCATRRSAGLPFMIQALVTTELQVVGNPRCFHSCMSAVLGAAGAARGEQARAHALNVVRALVRHAALAGGVAPYLGQALQLALAGFDRPSWAERNSCTLLFSALMVRVFGVSRSRDSDALCVRNKMTGRIFFLRYPHLYDFMLEKLQQVNSSEDAQVLQPSVYPVLLLLARLYPSSLEGTVSNLKLVAFVPHVLACAGSAVLKTRQLAARAMLPLVSPEHYIAHIQSMFALLTRSIKRNYCHGILLQLTRLLDAKPEDLGESLQPLHGSVQDTLWLLDQAVGQNPCYLIADEYVKVLNLILWRFPTIVQEDITTDIISYLDKLIFKSETPPITSGRDVCLSNAIYLYFIILNKLNKNPSAVIYEGLEHKSYEVVLSTLNYLLVLYNNLNETNCKLIEHLTCISNNNILDNLDRDKYTKLLCKVLNSNYLECQEKSLKILTLVGDTQKCIIEAKTGGEISEGMVMEELFVCLRDEHENLTHVYLESLLNFATEKLQSGALSGRQLLEVVRVVFEYSSSENSESTRSVVVQFIERNIDTLLTPGTRGLSDEEIFELKATTWCAVITLLEDDDEPLRTRIARSLTQALVTSQAPVTSRVASACAELVTGCIQQDGHSSALLLVIALLDFKSQVLTDDGNDECRVFDQNEKYNIFLEETVWTDRCADLLIESHKAGTSLVDWISSIVNKPLYRSTVAKLCNDNVVLFNKMVAGDKWSNNDALNPKIELFYNKLCK